MIDTIIQTPCPSGQGDGLLIRCENRARVRVSSVSFFLCRYGGVVYRARLEI